VFFINSRVKEKQLYINSVV